MERKNIYEPEKTPNVESKQIKKFYEDKYEVLKKKKDDLEFKEAQKIREEFAKQLENSNSVCSQCNYRLHQSIKYLLHEYKVKYKKQYK